MNLYCNKLDLWQTPTDITMMCLTQPNGTIAQEVKGKAAIRALMIYRTWISLRDNGVVFNNLEDLEPLKLGIHNHLEEIDSLDTKGLYLCQI